MNLSSRLEAARRQREQATSAEGLPTWRPEPTARSASVTRADGPADPPVVVDLTRNDSSLFSPPSAAASAATPAATPPPPASAPPRADETFAADVIELPGWARERGADPVVAPAPVSAPVDPHACTTCGGEARVDVLDLLSGIAHLECTKCGSKWKARTEPRTGPGRY
jgi:hypothetical protein